MAGFDNFAQGANNIRFIGKIHCQVRALPITHNTQPLKFAALIGDLFAGVAATLGAEFTFRNLVAGFANHAFNLVFNRQAMTIPARHIRRVKACQLPTFDDHVLEYFIDDMTNVDITVGVRRTIVQDEFGPPAGLLTNVLIKPLLVPAGQHLRLAFG